MKLKLAPTASVALLCGAIATSVPASASVAADILEAARGLCMAVGQLLLAPLALIDVRVVLTVLLLPLLLASALVVACQLRTRRFTARLLRSQQEPPPLRIRELTARLGVQGRTHVVESEQPLAFCAGVMRPRIFLSTGLLSRLSADELEAVLRHEAWHARRRDPLLGALGVAARRALFFLPDSGELFRRVLATRELEADDAAVLAMGTPYPLASALHKALRWSAASAPTMPGGFSSLDARIDHLLAGGDVQPRTRSRRMLATGLLASAALVLIVCGVTAASSAAASVPAAVCGAC